MLIQWGEEKNVTNTILAIPLSDIQKNEFMITLFNGSLLKNASCSNDYRFYRF